MPGFANCAAVPAPPPGTCPPGQTACTCALGPVTPGNRFGWFFEVNAHIANGTNDITACTEGQLARGSRAVGPAVGPPAPIPNPAAQAAPAGPINLPGGRGGAKGVNFNVVVAPGVYPGFAAANFGADDYVAPSSFKTHLDAPGFQRFRWLDGPSFGVTPPGQAQAIQQDELVSFVRGNLGTCWCQFRVAQQWSAAGGRQAIGGGASPNVLPRIDGQNCN